jgi:hypothetical protein
MKYIEQAKEIEMDAVAKDGQIVMHFISEHDKYEAYLKALISTGIVLPMKNILFSIGSYREKLEILPSVQKLHAAGYDIFATSRFVSPGFPRVSEAYDCAAL